MRIVFTQTHGALSETLEVDSGVDGFSEEEILRVMELARGRDEEKHPKHWVERCEGLEERNRVHIDQIKSMQVTIDKLGEEKKRLEENVSACNTMISQISKSAGEQIEAVVEVVDRMKRGGIHLARQKVHAILDKWGSDHGIEVKGDPFRTVVQGRPTDPDAPPNMIEAADALLPEGLEVVADGTVGTGSVRDPADEIPSDEEIEKIDEESTP
jgi:FtsZ-binding cell division protein ZapB